MRKGGGKDLSTSLSRSVSLTSARKLLRSWSSSASDDPMALVEGTSRGGEDALGGRGGARLGSSSGEDDEGDDSVFACVTRGGMGRKTGWSRWQNGRFRFALLLRRFQAPLRRHGGPGIVRPTIEAAKAS